MRRCAWRDPPLPRSSKRKDKSRFLAALRRAKPTGRKGASFGMTALAGGTAFGVARGDKKAQGPATKQRAPWATDLHPSAEAKSRFLAALRRAKPTGRKGAPFGMTALAGGTAFRVAREDKKPQALRKAPGPRKRHTSLRSPPPPKAGCGGRPELQRTDRAVSEELSGEITNCCGGRYGNNLIEPDGGSSKNSIDVMY